MDKSDALMYVTIMVVFAWFIVGGRIVGPELVMGVGFTILFGSIAVQEVWLITATAKYVYLRVTCRPSGKHLHLFISHAKTVPHGHSLFSTEFQTAYPFKYRNYGKLKKFVLIHHLPLAERFAFTPGNANFNGFMVSHHNTEEIVAYEYARGSFDIDHGIPIPVLKLAEAGNDFNHPKVILDIQSDETEARIRELEEVEAGYAEKSREALEYKQKHITAEESIDHMKVEVQGLLKLSSNFMSAVREQVLTLREKETTMDNVAKHWSKTSSMNWNNAVMVAVVVGGIAAVFVARPDLFSGLSKWLSASYVNMAFAFAILAIAGFVAYKMLNRKK